MVTSNKRLDSRPGISPVGFSSKLIAPAGQP